MRNIIPALQVHSHDASLISFEVDFTTYRGQEKEKWREFITLTPDERVVQVYKKVLAYIEKGEGDNLESGKKLVLGDLLLTNKRFIYLPYMLGRLPVFLSKTTSPTLKRVMPLLFALLPLILFQVFLPVFYYFSSYNAANTIFLFLYALPMSMMVAALFLSFLNDYDEASIEIPLEEITIIDGAVPSSLVLKPRNGGTVVLEFKDEAAKNSFKENLYSMVKQYTVYRSYAREFILNPDETITVKCPYCGAQTLLDKRQREIICNNCGKQYLLPDKILMLIKEESQSQKP
ncbi:hypothetical protein [Thermofilum sp.]|jgi:DNA-directed RNA polymerase subunit RPC12/RpoP|uniref:hypothetical protein n=1 Tax=Thermofilum sp. TaxID=1961369 RepID=UPI00258D684E|nr:hypothetical protein [Thermofilum sp.]